MVKCGVCKNRIAGGLRHKLVVETMHRCIMCDMIVCPACKPPVGMHAGCSVEACLTEAIKAAQVELKRKTLASQDKVDGQCF